MRQINGFIFFMLLSVYPVSLHAQGYWHDIPRKIRYGPDGDDIIIKNGDKRFNRALYGTHSDFRVEAGDLPEFALFLPHMGGNMKFGIISNDKSKWLIDADHILARYSPGSMIYDVNDGLLGQATLKISVLALSEAEGIVVKCELLGNTDARLIWVYGGACGKRFGRNGDIGADPESVFYLHPEYCESNAFKIEQDEFLLQYTDDRSKSRKELKGVFPPFSKVSVCDAINQETPVDLIAKNTSKSPVIAGEIDLSTAEEVFYFSVVKPETINYISYNDIERLFNESDVYRKTLASRVKLETPDPYLNTLGGVLAVAADGVWDGEAFMHGSVAWRMPLNGWRGAYLADPLGWGDRAKVHFKGYAMAQYLEPDSGPNVPDADKGLARQQEKQGNSIFTKGYISRRPGRINKPHHYDMNLVFIDQLIRYFDWTGDTAFLREMWPVIERHMAWEKRCFDGNRDGLYDAYCCIWASDALQYSGGGVTHSSAYNYFSNLKVARLAEILGYDGSQYEMEAEKIHSAMIKELWMPESGHFAEYKDLLGNKLLHPASAVWTYYHAIDSKVPDKLMAYRMMLHLNKNIPRIPVMGEGVHKGLYTISTTNWMPYDWSINNVALAEVMHTSLAYWQSGLNEEAFTLWKSALVESMYLGSSPGNIQQLSFYDAFRGELYRDFADPIGMVTRSLTEGLFGIQPDALNNRLIIQPGIPEHWGFANLHLPEISVKYRKSGIIDEYYIRQALPKTLNTKLVIKARYAGIKEIQLNGINISYSLVAESTGSPYIEIDCGKNIENTVKIIWDREELENKYNPLVSVNSQQVDMVTSLSNIKAVYDPEKALLKYTLYEKSLEAVTGNRTGRKTFYVKLKQNDLVWWQPVEINVIDPVSIDVEHLAGKKRIVFTNNLNEKLKLNVTVNYHNLVEGNLVLKPMEVKIIEIENKEFITGTNFISVVGRGIETKLSFTDWDLGDGKKMKYALVDLDHVFNDKVTSIFKNKYLSPRSPYPTLQLPVNGLGNWCYNTITANIDDTGLRIKAGKKNLFKTGLGFPLLTPGGADKNNIVYISLWDNYPDQQRVPLSGQASHMYLLLAGSTNPMQSRFTNGVIEVSYRDGSKEILELNNPETWWPIEQDYYLDGYAFNMDAPVPYRLHLKTGELTRYFNDYSSIKGYSDRVIDGGAATLLDLPLNPVKQLDNLVLKTLANDVVIGLMSVTLIK